MPKTLSIIICAYNEAETIRNVIDRVHAVDLGGWQREVIVVDNCSTDGTREILQQVDLPHTTIVYQPRNMGKGTSIRTAIEHLTGNYAVIQDADLEYDPQDIRLLLERAEEGALAVFGSRTLGGQAVYKYAHAYWGVRLITTVMNLLFGGNLTDAATATKMVRSDVLKSLNLVGRSFDLDFELPDKLLLAGIDIEEVPISYNPRTYAEGKKIKPRDGLEAFRVMLRDRLGLSRVWKDSEQIPSLHPTPIKD
ncbi:MAG: glycosyltransferase family 2 protein [Chloroflexi bacterium]|nr:glycosyltransferase family 2 protein [Chloroflexota bacterium]